MNFTTWHGRYIYKVWLELVQMWKWKKIFLAVIAVPLMYLSVNSNHAYPPNSFLVTHSPTNKINNLYNQRPITDGIYLIPEVWYTWYQFMYDLLGLECLIKCKLNCWWYIVSQDMWPALTTLEYLRAREVPTLCFYVFFFFNIWNCIFSLSYHVCILSCVL